LIRKELGESPKGLEQAFAALLQNSPSMWSQINASLPIGDRLARQIEALSGRAPGWLDEHVGSAQPNAAERSFVELARRAWRATNATGRRRLRQVLLETINATPCRLSAK
jgi:hypothetical protein